MKIQTIFYFIREAWTSLGRNRLLSIATATTIAICILILGMAVLLFINSREITNTLESDVEIVVFIKSDLAVYQRGELEDRITNLSGAKSVEFVSKTEALKELARKMGQDEKILIQTMENNNPLPDSFRVKAEKPQDVSRLAAAIAKMDGVEKTRYGQEIVKKLFIITRWVRGISLFTVIFLALAGMFLISTTIRISVFSRRKEIYIMKLVGATDWFVRMPFFIEGMVLSTIGTLIAVLILGVGYHYLYINVSQAMAFVPLVPERMILPPLGLGLIATGAVLGLAGTFISLNKFLDV